MSNDHQRQQLYQKYLSKYQNLLCPNCGNNLEYMARETYDNADNLISIVNLLCANCHYSDTINKKYSDCVAEGIKQ